MAIVNVLILVLWIGLPLLVAVLRMCMVLFPDWSWKWAVKSWNQTNWTTEVLQRTLQWERGRILSGSIFAMVGVFWLLCSLITLSTWH